MHAGCFGHDFGQQIFDIIMIVLLDTTRLYLLYVLFAQMLRTFTLVNGVTCEEYSMDILACVTFVFAFVTHPLQFQYISASMYQSGLTIPLKSSDHFKL